MDALENVALPLLYAGVPLKERRARAEEALKAVGLEERIHFMPNQLSGGQCQRVAIARAMVTKPALLLADEPTGALDTKAGNQIMDIFRDLSREGMTIIMITHEQSIADCADKIYYILDGELDTTGRRKEVSADETEV
jgi:putative ABC transport system ATP-binding protein